MSLENRGQLGAGLVIVVCLLVAAPAAAGGRKNIRDFPDSTFCPVNLGWFVDDGGIIHPPPDQPIRPASVTFTAEGSQAQVSFVACDRGLTDDHPDGMSVRVRNFAVVRRDVYEAHQTANPDPDFTCYVPEDFNFPHAQSVGSTFDPSVTPPVTANTLKFPFADDFANVAASRAHWRLDGADFETVNVSDPTAGFFGSANALVLARVPADASQNSCSTAKVLVRKLKHGVTYVVDFRWEIIGMNNAPEVDMLTFVDTTPNQ